MYLCRHLRHTFNLHTPALYVRANRWDFMGSRGMSSEERESLDERDRNGEFLRERWGLGEELGGSLQSGRDSQSAPGFLIGGRCNTCNESASARCGFPLMSEHSSCPWKTSGTLSHACIAHTANEFWRKCYVGWRRGGEELEELKRVSVANWSWNVKMYVVKHHQRAICLEYFHLNIYCTYQYVKQTRLRSTVVCFIEFCLDTYILSN